MSFIAGPYTAVLLDITGVTSYGSIGITERGFDLDEIQEGEEIVGDNLGKSTQDGVYQGGNCFCSFVASEANNDNINRLLYSQTVAGALSERGWIGYPGELWSAQSYRLTLTALYPLVTGAGSFEKNYYMYAVRLANRHAVRKALAAAHRKVPIRLQCLPVEINAVARWYSTDNA
jgi:hypothetical protein